MSPHCAAYGSPVFRRCALRVLACSQFAMVALLRCRLQSSLAHWAYFGLFPPQAAAFVRPPAASRPPTGRDRDGNAFLRFAPPCASLARCSVPAHFVCSALQPFGPSPFCKHLHPQFAIVDLHRSQARLQLSLLTGLTSACFVPQFAIVALLRCRLQVSFAHWTSASPVSRTARGEAPSHRRRPPCAPQKMPEMTYTPSFLI